MTTTLQTRATEVEVECLDCGTYRSVTGLTYDELGECDACGYIGWALAESITEAERRSLQSWHRELRLAAA